MEENNDNQKIQKGAKKDNSFAKIKKIQEIDRSKKLHNIRMNFLNSIESGWIIPLAYYTLFIIFLLCVILYIAGMLSFFLKTNSHIDNLINIDALKTFFKYASTVIISPIITKSFIKLISK